MRDCKTMRLIQFIVDNEQVSIEQVEQKAKELDPTWKKINWQSALRRGIAKGVVLPIYDNLIPSWKHTLKNPIHIIAYKSKI